ncbi:MAG: DNA repair protein RadC [Desulfobulbaceae bacterium]|nr:DNA repair protein RadC [Desulfobulbaceae bacterium]
MDKEEWQDKGAGHRQRLRDRFLERGMDGLSDAEILELLLTMGTPRKDCKTEARALLASFGTLAGVLEAAPSQLQQIPGVGPKNSYAIHFIQGVARRYLKQRLTAKQYVRSSAEVSDYLIHAMRDLKREVLMVIYLDASHAIIDSEIIAEGTLASNTVYPRELIKPALARHAAALVIAHNHPSGNQTPSAEDRRLTRNLYLALSLVNIRLLDHLIIAGSSPPYSFADHGLINQFAGECVELLR